MGKYTAIILNATPVIVVAIPVSAILVPQSYTSNKTRYGNVLVISRHLIDNTTPLMELLKLLSTKPYTMLMVPHV